VQEDFISLFEEEEGIAEPPVFDQAVALVLDVIERTGASTGEGSSNDEVLELIAGIGSRAHHHLRDLASTFASVDAAARITFNPKAAPQRTVTLRRTGAERLRRVLDETDVIESEIAVTGRLAGASTIHDNFELETADGTVLSGKVDEPLRPRLRDYFDTDCTATLRVRTARSVVDGAEVPRYTLIGIK
jgi:hypothetical protein